MSNDKANPDFRAYEKETAIYNAAEIEREDLERRYFQLFRDYRALSEKIKSEKKDSKRGNIVFGNSLFQFNAMRRQIKEASLVLRLAQDKAIKLRSVFIQTAEDQSKKSARHVAPLTDRRDKNEYNIVIADLSEKIEIEKRYMSAYALKMLAFIYDQSLIDHIEHAICKRELGLDVALKYQDELNEEINEALIDVDLMLDAMPDEDKKRAKRIMKYSSIVKQLKERRSHIEA